MADRLPLFWFWFKNPEDARTGTRRAAYAGVASAALTVVFVVWALASPASGLGGQFDAWSLIDVALMLALSYGTYRGSRVTAVGLLGLFVVGQILIRIESGNASNLFLTVVFGALFAQGVAGAFALHRFRSDVDLSDQLAALEAGEPEATDAATGTATGTATDAPAVVR